MAPSFASPSRQLPGEASYSPSSPTARRQAAGRPHPAPLELSPKTTQVASMSAPDSPPRTTGSRTDSSLNTTVLSSTPPITPTRKTPTSASSLGADSANGKERDRTFGAGPSSRGMDRISSAQSSASTGAPSGRVPSASQRAPQPFSSSSNTSSAQRRPSILGYNVTKRASSFQQQAGGANSSGGGAMSNTRFLLTVIPPSHLPHDPPHPKSNPNCSGYGPPEHFKRGTLIPLYPTLSSQLAAIAREYGLPSTGGLVLYLLSTTDPSSSVQASLPGAAGFEGGPRISEEAWNLLWRRLFDEEEEIMILAESDDEDGYAPPVPPIPLSHRNNPSDATSSADPTFSTFADSHRNGQQQSRRVASESDQALLSDGGEQELERTSFSSEGDHEGSVYSGGVENGVAEGSKGNSADRRSSARSAIGRGHPSTLPSPNGSTRFASAPNPSGSRYSSYTQPNMRHPSRQSVRSNASRFGRSSYAPSGRATAMSNYSSPQLGGEAFGAAVVVGKVEFDIDRRRGGKSKWYEGWMESAAEPASSGTVSGGTTSAVTSPRLRQGAEQEELIAQRSIVQVAEQESSPFDIDSSFPLPPTTTRNVGGLAPSRGLRPLELSRSASPTGSMIEKPEDPMSPESVAASGYSNAAAAGHGDDESIDDRARSPSLAPSSPQHSRSSSLASSIHQQGHDGYAPLVDADAAPYAQLEDDDASNHFESGRESRQSQVESEESDYDAQVEQVERGEQEMAKRRESEVEQELAEQGSRTATLQQDDPLSDVFPDDEATWRTFSQEPRFVDEAEMVETTGLGIVGARVLDLKSTTAPGVLERSPQEESSDEAGLPPPQDDVADVVQLLKSGQSEDKTDKVNLASPIHLDSSPTAPSTTGVFEEPSHSFDDSHPAFDDSGISFDTSSLPFEEPSSEPQTFDTSADPTDLATRRRSTQRPRFGSGASARALNLVSIDVRPPSTVHSSPEYAPQRKQRQGWTTIPPVVDRSMSASTSLASLDSYEQPDSQRDSTIGLMENLDDLERALADLSPTTSRRSPAITQEEPTPEPSPRALPPPAAASSFEQFEKEVESDDEEAAEKKEATEEQTPTFKEEELPLLDEDLSPAAEEASQIASPAPAFEPLNEPLDNPESASVDESESAPVAPAPPFAYTSRSATASPVLGSRPPFRYGNSSSNVVNSPTFPPATLEPPPRPPRGDSLAVATDHADSTGSEQETRPETPSKSTFDLIPLAGAFSSPEQIPLLGNSEPTPAPGDSARTPRTSSLSRTTPRSAHQVALPPSPMPPQSESAWRDATTPTLPSHSFASAPTPSSPRQPLVSQRLPPPMPPVPTKEDEITFPEPPQRSPKSPSGFKALRNKSSWRKNKEIDVAKASAATSENAESSESTKSPVTGFFAKPAFQKFGGMFNKKSGADASPDPSGSSSTAAPEFTSSLDQQRKELAHEEEPISPPYERMTSSPPLEASSSTSRQQSTEPEEPFYTEEVSLAPVDYSKVSTSSFSGDFPPITSSTLASGSDTTPLLRPTPTPLPSSSYSLQPAGSTDSFRTAFSSLPVRSDSSSPATPAPQSVGNITPTDGTFPTSYASSSTYTPLPPLPYDPISTDAEYSISSPRSEYGAPHTPVQGPSAGYAASAPATPAAWSQNKHYLEPGSRFGKGIASGGGRQAAKQQLSADIDQLLSQMNEIDFGGEEDGASSLGETSRGSENETQEYQPLASSPQPGPSTPVTEREDLGELTEDKRDRSMDIGASLGGLMMAGSLPSSPTAVPSPRA